MPKVLPRGLAPLGWALFAALVGGVASSDRVGAALQYCAAAVQGGAYWRLLSAGLTHTNPAHGLLNLAALALLLQLFGAWRRPLAPALLAALATSVFALDYGLGWHDWARGLSGPLHGFAMAGALLWLRPTAAELVVCAGLLKVALELGLPGASADSSVLIGAPVLVDHHALGLGLGLALGAALRGVTACGSRRVDSPPT